MLVVKKIVTFIRYSLENIGVMMLYVLFYIMGMRLSSKFASIFIKPICKRLSVNRLAKENIKTAFPNVSKKQENEIIDGMWENFCCMLGEFVHIPRIKDIDKFVEIDRQSLKNIEAIRDKGGIIFSAHIGNWEMGMKVLSEYGVGGRAVYRPSNNKFVDNIIIKTRGIGMIAKGAKGAKEIISDIRNKKFIIMFVDQRLREGINVPFFKKDAMTPSSPATLALKYNVPLIPVYCIREKNKFRFHVGKAIKYNKTDNNQEDTYNIMSKINKELEKWIIKYPEQWFWVHSRWK